MPVGASRFKQLKLLNGHLHFITETSYKERLISLNILPECFWHMLPDMFFFHKATHNLVHVSPSIVPTVHKSARTTQTSPTSLPIFVSKRCRTTTYQKPFLIRTTRIWNLLTGRMDLANATPGSFKSLLHDYYYRAVRQRATIWTILELLKPSV